MQNSNRIISMLTFLLVAACARTSPDSSDPEPYLEPMAATAPSEKNTHDDEIFGVLDAINDEGIAHGEFMKKWAKSQRVKQFAAFISDDHVQVRDRQKRVRRALDLRTSDSRVASELREDSRQKLNTLQRIDKGDPLDAAFVDITVDVLAGWLGVLDNQAIPEAETPELIEELEEVRKLVDNHYTLALDLRGKLGKAAK